MKKILMALFLLLPLISFAQTPQLPEGSDAQKRYAANHLKIVQTYPKARLTSKKSRHWTAFKGEQVLTEEEFFAIAGRPDLVVAGKRNVDRQYRIKDAAPTLVGLGTGAIFSGLIVSSEGDDASKTTGQAISGVGVGMAVTGLWKLIFDKEILPGNSIQTAALAANEYNDRLMMALLLESQQVEIEAPDSGPADAEEPPLPAEDDE